MHYNAHLTQRHQVLLLLWSVLFYGTLTFASTTAPPHRMLTPELLLKISTKLFNNYKVRPIGACVWFKFRVFHSSISTTLALDEWLPDLIVTVANSDGSGFANGDNPWWEAKTFLDPPARLVAHAQMRRTTGFDYSTGHTSGITNMTHYDSIRHKIVDVIGSPFMTLPIPFKLRSDTRAFTPYYQSQYDAYQDRTGLAENVTRPLDSVAFTHPIGNQLSHWAYVFPRSMTVNNANNYKASLVAALRAADLVTNNNTLHTIHSVSNRCGKNCAVANVTEETSRKGDVIWQEVYPNNRNKIVLGQDDSLSFTPIGQSDDNKGHGNYIFVLWRHYRGCQQHSGRLIFSFPHVHATRKR